MADKTEVGLKSRVVEQEVRLGRRVLRGIKDPRARQVLMDLPAARVIKVLQGPQDRRAKQAALAQQARQARKET